MNLTYEQILPLLLALLLIFILPMLMRRYGLRWEDLLGMLTSRFGKKDYETEAKRIRDDLKALVSSLLMMARRYKTGLVYPGTIAHKGQIANLLALVVTRQEVIGINCFGYGGTITEDKKTGVWNQHMNGVDQRFDSPLQGNARQLSLVRAAMDENGMSQIPFRVAAVFTAHGVELHTGHPREVFTSEGLLAHLKECCAADEGTLDPDTVARQLNALVKRIRT